MNRWWRLLLGTLLVLTGLATAILTLMARRLGVPELTTAGAIASLVLVLLIMVLVVPPLTRSAFAEMAATGFPIEVTTGGAIFVVILVIVGFAAWNTANNLLFMVLSIMLSTIFVSWMAARVSLRDLNVSARFPDHIFAGEQAEVVLNNLYKQTQLQTGFGIIMLSIVNGQPRELGLIECIKRFIDHRVEVLVPPGCEVRLNAEPIRLRLLEPGDPVEVDVVDSGDGSVAAAIRTGRPS